MPITPWPQYADHPLALICRSRLGSYMPVGDIGPGPNYRWSGRAREPPVFAPDHAAVRHNFMIVVRLSGADFSSMRSSSEVPKEVHARNTDTTDRPLPSVARVSSAMSQCSGNTRENANSVTTPSITAITIVRSAACHRDCIQNSSDRDSLNNPANVPIPETLAGRTLADLNTTPANCSPCTGPGTACGVFAALRTLEF